VSSSITKTLTFILKITLFTFTRSKREKNTKEGEEEETYPKTFLLSCLLLNKGYL